MGSVSGWGGRVHLTLEPSPTASRVCTQAPDSRLSPGSMSLVALVPLHRAAAAGTRGCSRRDPRLQLRGPEVAAAGPRGCRAASCAREGRRDGRHGRREEARVCPKALLLRFSHEGHSGVSSESRVSHGAWRMARGGPCRLCRHGGPMDVARRRCGAGRSRSSPSVTSRGHTPHRPL